MPSHALQPFSHELLVWVVFAILPNPCLVAAVEVLPVEVLPVEVLPVEVLPVEVGDLFVNIFYYFNKSAKRKKR